MKIIFIELVTIFLQIRHSDISLSRICFSYGLSANVWLFWNSSFFEEYNDGICEKTFCEKKWIIKRTNILYLSNLFLYTFLCNCKTKRFKRVFDINKSIILKRIFLVNLREIKIILWLSEYCLNYHAHKYSG